MNINIPVMQIRENSGDVLWFRGCTGNKVVTPTVIPSGKKSHLSASRGCYAPLSDVT